MGNKWWVILPISFLITGCSTVSNKRLNNLETKVGALEAKVDSVEQRQSAIEGQTGESRESVGYLKGKVDSRGPSTVVVTGTQGNEGYLYKSGKKSLTHKEIQLALKNAGFCSRKNGTAGYLSFRRSGFSRPGKIRSCG